MVLSLEDLTVRNDKGLKAIKNVSFTIHAGEIFGIAGVAGNGQKELTEAVCGLRKVQKGRVCLKGEDITHLSIRENIDKGVALIPEDPASHGTCSGTGSGGQYYPEALCFP